MSMEGTQAIAECWQLLLEYIPERDHNAASEHLITFCRSVFTNKEMLEIADLDSDLATAYENIAEVEGDNDDYDPYADEDSEDE
jgi:hypothetical protein